VAVRLDWRLVAAGIGAGLLSGLLGVGGGIIIVPLLVGTLRFDQHSAHATSLAAIVLIALSAGVAFAVAGDVDYRLGGAIGLAGLVGSTAGAQLMHRLSPRRLKLVFAFVLLASGVRLLL
jgi:uncharacterized membrane protein YfcA